MISEEPEVSLINVKLRLGTTTMYTEKVYIDFQLPVSALRKKIREKDNSLEKVDFVMVYSGNIMEDRAPIYMYELINGATVHLFKQIKIDITENPNFVEYTNAGLAKLGTALRSLSLNSSYKCALMKISKTKMLNDLFTSVPELNYDPISITLLQHPELLVKLNDANMVNDIASSHIALSTAAIQISAFVHDQLVQVNLSKLLNAYFYLY